MMLEKLRERRDEEEEVREFLGQLHKSKFAVSAPKPQTHVPNPHREKVLKRMLFSERVKEEHQPNIDPEKQE